MKKIITSLMAIALVSAMASSVSAIDVTESDTNPKDANTEIITSVLPSYIVTIPQNLTIPFNSTSTELGTIKAEKLQLEPNKVITVSADAGKLVNQRDSTSTLAYKLMQGTEVFTSVVLSDTGLETNLNVDIEEDDWNKAPAGAYKGTVTFTVAYTVMETN